MARIRISGVGQNNLGIVGITRDITSGGESTVPVHTTAGRKKLTSSRGRADDRASDETREQVATLHAGMAATV